MDKFFNPRAAKWARDLVMKMDRDEAELFVRCATLDILTADIEANRRTVDAHAREVHKRLATRVSKALVRNFSDKQSGEYLAAAATLAVVSKAFEEKEHPRDRSGRFRRKAGTSEVEFHFKRTRGEKEQPPINLTQALGRTGGRVTQFEQEWNRTNPEHSSTNRRTYDRIAAGSKLLSSSGNPKMMVAGQFGEFVGRYGPEAEKVIGPHLRRTSYRYRGTERRVDPALIRSTNDKTRDLLRGQKNQEVTPELRADASRQEAARYLLRRLPSTKLTDLQLKSGKIPPSEGVIINADGKIITQAVGYSDDHYLPFNLKNLKGLQGGQYVRSRAAGGPTTEDIYAGLVSGARSVTVVSRSGIFTIDFDDAFRGSRRYNDKAAQMVGRYGKLLDAIKSEQVERTKLSPEDRARLRDEVESEMQGMGYSLREIESAVQQRIKEYKANPELSREELVNIEQEARDAAQGDERQYRIARAEFIDRAMESKASNKYRLDGEGYAAALDALREQFPYYIDQINYVHRKSGESGLAAAFSTESDTGYVAPRYLRPGMAQEGYFDREVNGRGKVSAKHINYANWQHNPERGRTSEAQAPNVEEVKAPERKRNLTDELRVAERRAATNKAAKDALQGAVRQIAAMLQDDVDPVLKQLIDNPSQFDTVFADPIRRRRIENLVRSEFASIDNEENRNKYGERYSQLDKLLDEYRLHSVALERETFDPKQFDEALGNSPSAPFSFSEPEYRLGEVDRPAIERAWAKLGIPLDINETNDDELRRHANGWGGLAKRLQAGEQDPRDIAEFLVDSGLSRQPAVQTFVRRMTEGPLSDEQREQMTSQARRNAELYERARRLKANHGQLPEAPAVEAPRETTFSGEAKVQSLPDRLESMAADLSASESGRIVAQGYGRIAQLLRDYNDGELSHEELLTEVEHQINRYGGGEIIHGLLRRAGLLD